MNILFAFAGAFTVANLYYNQPILNILAAQFGVSYEEVSRIPTLAQSGYCAGLLFLCPLGDLFKRRPFVLLLIFVSATLWIALCTTNSFNVFSAFSFLNGVTTVTPQLMLPLVGDLAPPHRRALALSVVSSGNILGILIARILSGVVTQFTSWRNIYWIALALQYFILTLLWLFMPDYPSTNPGGLNYFHMLAHIFKMLGRYPVLVQACVISFVNSATFTSYWTTLTFLLSGAPYHYSTLVIGLFALLGILAIVTLPLYAKYLIDPFVPLFSTVIALILNIVGTCIGTYIGEFSVAGPIIMALVIDAGFQISQVSNRSAIFPLEPKARNRLNTAYMVCTFLGQITGTSAGNRLYAQGGWVASGSLSVALLCFGLLITLARGPYEETKTWIGWKGGVGIRKRNKNSADGRTEEKAAYAELERGWERGAEATNTEKALEEAAGEDGQNVVRTMRAEEDAGKSPA